MRPFGLSFAIKAILVSSQMVDRSWECNGCPGDGLCIGCYLCVMTKTPSQFAGGSSKR